MAAAVNKLTPPASKTELAKQLGISRSVLYYQPKMPAKNLTLKTSIEKVMSVHKSYGHRRIAIELGINKKRARRVMKLFNLQVKRRRKKPKKPADLDQESMAIPNLTLGLTIDAPSNVWVTDFTYLPFFGKFVYLATVEDVFIRRVIGWTVATRHTTDLVSLALLDAVINNSKPKIIHSDQEAEYRAQE